MVNARLFVAGVFLPCGLDSRRGAASKANDINVIPVS
jgi:hypothetical protein